MYQSAKGWVIYVCSKEEVLPTTMLDLINPKLSVLFEDFVAIFGDAKGLSPQRSHEHHIPLILGAQSVNLRHYRHSWEQKKTSLRR